METVKTKLRQITDAWNHYFLNYKECNRFIRFDDEVRTNYYGDILSYFTDTLDILSNVVYKKDFNESIIQSVGLLQILYVQQDLIDELLRIFKLPKSSGDSKSINRNIRNELVGHPIRRRDDKLVSSVFYGNNFGDGRLDYVLYTVGDRFRGKSVSYDLDEILRRHDDFLNEYLNLIITKLKSILNKYKKRLSAFNDSLPKTDLHNVVTQAQYYFESIFKNDPAYTYQYLMFCDTMEETHPRYSELKKGFLIMLKEHIEETISSIPELFVPKTYTTGSIPIIDFITISSHEAEIETPKLFVKTNYDYEFSKLAESHPVFGFDYFNKIFIDDIEVLTELRHLYSSGNEAERSCSLNYTKKLLRDRGLLSAYY